MDAFELDGYESDRVTMAVVACVLADDSEGAVALLEPLDARDACRIAVRLAAMAAHALLIDAEASGADRAQVLARWQASILDHESRRER